MKAVFTMLSAGCCSGILSKIRIKAWWTSCLTVEVVKVPWRTSDWIFCSLWAIMSNRTLSVYCWHSIWWWYDSWGIWNTASDWAEIAIWTISSSSLGCPSQTILSRWTVWAITRQLKICFITVRSCWALMYVRWSDGRIHYLLTIWSWTAVLRISHSYICTLIACRAVRAGGSSNFRVECSDRALSRCN